MSRNGNGKPSGVVGNPAFRKYDLTNIDNYEPDYEMPWADRIEKIYEVPAIDNMAGVFIRGIFGNERKLNAHLRLMYRHKKFGDNDHQEMLRCKIAGSAGVGGVGRLDALFAAIGMLAPEMYRTARNLPLPKRGKREEQEQVVRGSDFRQDGRTPPGGLGGQ